MSDKHFVGLDIVSFSNNGKYDPVSRVTLKLDDENVLTAGDDTGLELVADCPYGTQEMAEALLAKFQGYEYQPYEAEAAGIDPAAELGDGVTVNGVYSIVARMADDGDGYPSLSAPGEAELEDEYPFDGPLTREFNRKIADVRSEISKSAESIKLAVFNDDRFTSLEVTAEGLAVTTQNKDGSYTITLKDGIVTANAIAAGSITGDKIAAYSITADRIDTTDLIAERLMGAEVSLLTDKEVEAGVMSITGATTSDFAIDLTSGGALRLKADYGAVYLAAYCEGENSGRPSLTLGQYDVTSVMGDTTIDGVAAQANTLFPNTSTGCVLGHPRLGMWAVVYAQSDTILTSDRNRKNSIEELPEKYLTMFDGLAPMRFKLNDGTSDRYHVGFIAQEVEETMTMAGIDSQEFGGFVKDIGPDGEDIYMLRYGEFIGVLTAKIKQLECRLCELEGG